MIKTLGCNIEQVDQKPIVMSWIIKSTSKSDPTESVKFYLNSGSPPERPALFPSFGICQCPGKVLARGRDGKQHIRSIQLDMKYFREQYKVDMIVCLLDKYELRTIGVDADEYKSACEKNGIEIKFYVIVEMGCPNEKPNDFERTLLDQIDAALSKGKRVICHCRGGIGRAGTIACCMLIKFGLAKSCKEAVNMVREIRDPRCVESKKQMDFILSYSAYKKTI